MARPTVSFVVPARNADDGVDAPLESIARQRDVHVQDVIVVDGDSADDTVQAARDHGAAVVQQAAGGAGARRHLGAEHATGEYVAFVDPGTSLRPSYARRMLDFVAHADVAAASSRCAPASTWRGKPRTWAVNHVFPRLAPPVLPGFNTFVERAAYLSWGGFPDVPNAAVAFSRGFGRAYDTAFCRDALVAPAGCRFADDPVRESAGGVSAGERPALADE